mmetsp:Transcript_19929/g.29817  ORF Transcript_19929/g.29817 Transcript_19929/m.29817 type:complete len:831 (+) Transcript_19929:94-2586(+)
MSDRSLYLGSDSKGTSPCYGPQDARPPTPRAEVKTRSDGNYAIIVRSDGDSYTKIPFSSIVGIRFEILHEKLREKVDGCIVIVRRTNAVGFRQWASWIYFLLFLFATTFSVHDIVGPFTSFIVVICWIVSVTRVFFDEGMMQMIRKGFHRKRHKRKSFSRYNGRGRMSDLAKTRRRVSPHVVVRRHSSPRCFLEGKGMATPDNNYPAPKLVRRYSDRRLSGSPPPFNLEKSSASIDYFTVANRIDKLVRRYRKHGAPIDVGAANSPESVHRSFSSPTAPKDFKGRNRKSANLGPLINWTGQLSVFYILVWRIPMVMGITLDRRILLSIVIALGLILHRGSLRKDDGFVETIYESMKREGVSSGPFGTIRLLRPPYPTFPIRVKYSQSEIPELLVLRSAILKIPAGRKAIRDVAVGGYWTEGITSALVPSRFYNSIVLRKLGHIVINFLVPAFFILQGFSVLVPWAWAHLHRIGLLLGEDIGVYVLRVALQMASSGLGKVMLTFQNILPSFANIFSQLAVPLRLIASLISWIFRSFLQVLWDYIVPSDAFLTYARARFIELQTMASPAFNLAARLYNSLLEILRYFTAPLMSLMRMAQAFGNLAMKFSIGTLNKLLSAMVPLMSAWFTIIRAITVPFRLLLQAVIAMLTSGIRILAPFIQLFLAIGRAGIGFFANICNSIAALVAAALGLVRNLALRVPGLAKFAKQIGDQFIMLQKRDPLFWHRLRLTGAFLTLGIMFSLTALLLSPAVAVTVAALLSAPFLVIEPLKNWFISRIQLVYTSPSSPSYALSNKNRDTKKLSQLQSPSSDSADPRSYIWTPVSQDVLVPASS